MASTSYNPKGVNGFTPSVSEAYSMVGKCAKQIIKGIEGDNRLAEFHRGTLENGEYVEDVVLEAVAGSALTDKVPGEPFSAPEAKAAVRIFKDGTPKQYKVGITQRNLRKYLTQGTSVEEVAGIIVNNLAQSAENDDYIEIRNLFKNMSGEDFQYVSYENAVTYGEGSEIVSVNYKGILKHIKNIVDGMKFMNNKYNAAGITRRTRPEDIRIIMTYKLFNALNVDELAATFNMSVAELKEKVILIDETIDGGESTHFVFIVDKNAIQVWTRLYELSEAWDAQQLRMNYFLTVDRIYGVSALYDAVAVELSGLTDAALEK